MDIQSLAVAMAILGVATTGLYVWLGLQGIRLLQDQARGGSRQASVAAMSPVRELAVGGGTFADALSERECEVLQLVAEGYDNARIANDLFIAEGTVKNHITNIYGKIGVRTRAEAVAWAWRHGIVEERRP